MKFVIFLLGGCFCLKIGLVIEDWIRNQKINSDCIRNPYLGLKFQMTKLSLVLLHMPRRWFEDFRQVQTCLSMSRRGRGRYLARVKPPPKKCYLFMEGVLRPHFWTHYRVGSDLQEDQFRFWSDLLRRPQEDKFHMMRRHYWACPVAIFWSRRSCLSFPSILNLGRVEESLTFR